MTKAQYDKATKLMESIDFFKESVKFENEDIPKAIVAEKAR